MRKLILVDLADRPLGFGEKLEIHKRGILHRAFSLFLCSPEGKLLLQRRALDKYHSPGLWTNACCSHPAPDVELHRFVAIRAKEELGVAVDSLREMGSFVYYKDFGDGLKEFELDHVFVGMTREEVIPDPREVMDMAWVKVSWAMEDLRLHPEKYTAWYPTAFSLALPGLDKFGEDPLK